jgi:hypothetical protein
VKRNGFGVLHVHDLGNTLRSKGVDFKEECKIFEVCNPHEAAKVLATDMRLNMALPCRISVYTEGGKTNIGVISPSQLFNLLTNGKVCHKSFESCTVNKHFQNIFRKLNIFRHFNFLDNVSPLT